jgi:hypothetical protein
MRREVFVQERKEALHFELEPSRLRETQRINGHVIGQGDTPSILSSPSDGPPERRNRPKAAPPVSMKN